ncbi:MAG TPA: hypothetical protein VGM03_20345 [Phycisphaerae bacterium]
MTLQIELSPEVEAKLREAADISGRGVAALVIEAVEDRFAPDVHANAEDPARLTANEWAAELDAWAVSHPRYDGFVDDSRESIYAWRGE